MEKQQQLKIIDIVKRNSAIAELLGFKRYLPNAATVTEHKRLHQTDSIRWYVIPDRGRYCNYELRFNVDYNWLISACLEFIKKYQHANKPGTSLYFLYHGFAELKLNQITMEYLWFALSEYALEVVKQKDVEND